MLAAVLLFVPVTAAAATVPASERAANPPRTTTGAT